MRKLPDTKFNQTSGKVSWKDCPTIDYRSEGEIWLWQIQLL